MRLALVLVMVIAAVGSAAEGDSVCEQESVPIGAVIDELSVKCAQGWGGLGRDCAAVPPGQATGSPLQLGERVFETGLGHHAPGELVLSLPVGQYKAFHCVAGVHWQGGGRGSVILQVFVDGEKQFDSGVINDSSAPQVLDIPIRGARELRLAALDGGDGIACDMTDWADARLVREAGVMCFGGPRVVLSGMGAPAATTDFLGFSLLGRETGPQVAALGRNGFAVCLTRGEEVFVEVPVWNLPAASRVAAEVLTRHGQRAWARIAIEDGADSEVELSGDGVCLETSTGPAPGKQTLVRFLVRTEAESAVVHWRNVRVEANGTREAIPVMPEAGTEVLPPPHLPALRPGMEELLIEWDWRMADGIGTLREPRTYADATGRLLARGRALIEELQGTAPDLEAAGMAWKALEERFAALTASGQPDTEPSWETLWLDTHWLRRKIALMNPLADVGPILFAKHVPSSFSHQLTQYYGRCARAGGGLCVLESPGKTMRCRELTAGLLPEGSFIQPEVGYAAERILFAYCPVPSTPDWDQVEKYRDRRYHLYEIRPDGSALRQMTEGAYDDFSPKELPSGELIFISTRRGGFHRCGRGPCDVYTLAIANADGSNPRTVSFHETNEWDPAVLADGRVIYTRWDYVDRNAVHYQHLWSVRPDGALASIFYGNNTFNPVGIWEARPVPGTPLVMATAAAHHAMTAGSIVLVDRSRGVDGLAPITRLTPDAPFPESETHVLPAQWHAPGSPKEYVTPEEERRWPGHNYKCPYPLSEKFFLASYSFEPLIGEPGANPARMFGLYLVDAFGNRELLYRDLAISSVWPIPLRPRSRPPELPALRQEAVAGEGVFFVQNVRENAYGLPDSAITRLRIVQVLPKTTWNANDPTVGLANASPGKQVLGTVPVESDGSAYFRAPAGVALSFQALDERGCAVQVMRSVTYLQPGELSACVGCHEHRLGAAPTERTALALKRAPSAITPAPEGSHPLSYPLLVQPVLDRHCTECHGGAAPAGPNGQPLVLTGEPEGRYTRSYNALAPRVPYSSWGGLEENGEPATQPDRFGARASRLMRMLIEGHHEVQLDASEMERLATWMDANALFYGTFKPEDQARQQRGERIEGPALQ